MWETPFEESMLTSCENLIIHCPDGELAEYLMEILERNGVRWSGRVEAPTSHLRWDEYESETCYWVESKELTYSDRQYADEDPDHEASGHIKCTFYGLEGSDFDVASDDELCSLLGVSGA